jgi:hypothetical protein
MTRSQANLARHYLLGQLSEAEQEALEKLSFSDDERWEEIRAAENRLVDDYVRGQLPHAERTQFERHYLDSPPHRERVAVARMLLAKADAANAPAPSRWEGFLMMLRAPQLAWGVALAVLLVMLIGGTRLLQERTQLRAQLAQPNTPVSREHALEEQLAAARAENAQLAAKLAERERLPQTESSPPVAPKVFAFALTAGLLRGDGTPQKMVIPRGVTQIALQMRLPANDHSAYQASLRTVEGAAIWNQRRLKPRAGKVTLILPAAKLPVNDYMLTLSGLKDGTAETVQRYFFRVSHP